MRGCGPRLLAAAAAAALHFGGADARAAEPDADLPRLAPVIVTGKRASLMSAQEIKRDQLGMVDAVVADDINKLPDFGVTDAVQRISGVQVARDRGDGSGVAIRGLGQMTSTLNGREVFTAGPGRNLEFADIPAEMVARIELYKSASAEQIEGGIGGAIDLRTRRPFDFSGPAVAASARLIQADLAQRAQPQFSLLASERWRGAGGEFGALATLSRQQRAWREDQKGSGNPIVRTDLIPGQSVLVPNGTSESSSAGLRERDAGALALQWRPGRDLELYAEADYAQFRTRQDTYQINALPSPTFVPGSVVLFPGRVDLQSITWTNAPLSIASFARDTLDRTGQAALGGRWRDGALTLTADLSQTTSHNQLYYAGPVMTGKAAGFTHDLSGPVPASSVSGTDLLDAANLSYRELDYRARAYDAGLGSARLDGSYQLSGSWFDALAAGARYARRRAGNASGLIVADTPLGGFTPAERPELLQPKPYSAFLPGQAVSSIGNFMAGDLSLARDAAALRGAFGIGAPLPAAASPSSLWDIDERTAAAYVQATFQDGPAPLAGNAGLRVVRTQESVAGAQSAAGGFVPLRLEHSYTDFLPSLNLRYQLAAGLYLRGAASRTITRPDFNQLSPSLTLLRNGLDPSLNQGGAGNPELKPVRANNLDLALERYFSPTSSVGATAFVKNVDGFTGTVSSPETYDGVTYQVSRPHNRRRARIRGAELAYQQFFDCLPQPLNGFGLQANYTYVDSATPNDELGANMPLQNLSRHSANLVGMYERERVSARIAYNWRARFLSGISNVVGIGALPIYTHGYGWLDASFGYRLNAQVTLALEGMNLLRTVRRAYYGVETRPQSVWLNDRQFSLTATLRF